MANVIDCVVKNLDASGSGTPEEKSGIDSSGLNNGDRRKRCEPVLRITAVAAAIAIVWGLIIMSVVSPYFPRDYKVHAATWMKRTYSKTCNSLKQATLLNKSDFDDNLIMNTDTPKGN